MTSSIQKGHLPVSTSSASSSIAASNIGGSVNVGRGETEEFVNFLFREGFLIKGTRMESYDFHSITPSLSYLIQRNSENFSNGCHTIISAYSSLALKKQSYSIQGKNFNLISKSNIKDENIDTNSQKISNLADSKTLHIEIPKQFEEWRANDIGIGFLLYGETACFVLARMIELAFGRATSSGIVTCCVLSPKTSYLENEPRNTPLCNTATSLNTNSELRNEVSINQWISRGGIIGESQIDVPVNLFILNPYLEVGEIQTIIELEVKCSNSVNQIFACRSDLIELGMTNFELSTKAPCFLLAVKCSIDLTLPIYVYKRNVESNCCALKTANNCSMVIGGDFQLSIEILMSFYTWLKTHLLNPKSPFFDLDYGKFYYTRALELLSNIEYIVRVSGGVEKTISTVGGNINLSDVGLGICGGGSGLSRHFGISKFGTPNSRCSISTVASTNTPVSIGDVQADQTTATNANLCMVNLLPGGDASIQGVSDSNAIQESSSITDKDYISNNNPSVSGRGKRNNVKFTNTITPGQNSSSAVSTLVPGTIVRFRSQIPVDAKLIQGVPETDYFTHVQQVYYHFQKGEWRAVYGPSKNRQQKSFSVNKYGFYEAKRLAEEWRLRYLYSNPNGTNGQQNAAYGKCMRCGNGMAGNSGSCGRNACVKSGVDCVCKYSSNGIYEETRSSGGNTRCRTGRKRRSSRNEIGREVGGVLVASLPPGCVHTKLPNKGNGICSLEGASGYTSSEIGEVLSDIPALNALKNHNSMAEAEIPKVMARIKPRSPRVPSQNMDGEGGARSAHDSVYSSIDGMIAFGNAEFSASIPDQKPLSGKIPVASSQSPKDKPILHPSISGTNFVCSEPPGFKDPLSQKSLDISASSTASTTPSNTPGGLTGGCISLGGLGYDQVQKSYESDELLGVSSCGGVGMAINTVNNGIRTANTSKLVPSISSPVSLVSNSCSPIISPDKQQQPVIRVGAGDVISGRVHSVAETPYSVSPSSKRAGISYSVQSGLVGISKSVKHSPPSSSCTSSSPSSSLTHTANTPSSSQEEGITSKAQMMLSQAAQGMSIGFPVSASPYSGHFNTIGISEPSYGGCISPVIEESCWNNSANNEVMASSIATNSNLVNNIDKSGNKSIGGTLSIPTGSSSSSTSISSSTNINVNKSRANNTSSVNDTITVLNTNDDLINTSASQNSESLGVGGGGCVSTAISRKDNIISCSNSSSTEVIPTSSVNESSTNNSEIGSGKIRNNNEENENSDRRNVSSDVNRGNGNPWMKRNAWDEDLIIDSFFVG